MGTLRCLSMSSRLAIFSCKPVSNPWQVLAKNYPEDPLRENQAKIDARNTVQGGRWIGYRTSDERSLSHHCDLGVVFAIKRRPEYQPRATSDIWLLNVCFQIF